MYSSFYRLLFLYNILKLLVPPFLSTGPTHSCTYALVQVFPSQLFLVNLLDLLYI